MPSTLDTTVSSEPLSAAEADWDLYSLHLHFLAREDWPDTAATESSNLTVLAITS